jgi:hypothetical protein
MQLDQNFDDWKHDMTCKWAKNKNPKHEKRKYTPTLCHNITCMKTQKTYNNKFLYSKISNQQKWFEKA